MTPLLGLGFSSLFGSANASLVRKKLRRDVLKALLVSDEYFEEAMIHIIRERGYDIKKKPEPEPVKRSCITCRDSNCKGNEEPCTTCAKLDNEEYRTSTYPLWVQATDESD